MMKKTAGILSGMLVLSLLNAPDGWASSLQAAPEIVNVSESSDPLLSRKASHEKEIADLINAEREKQSLPAFTVTPSLSGLAGIKAEEASLYFSHTRPNGTSCFTVLSENGVDYQRAGENLALGQGTPEEAVKDWMNSDPHRKNILSQDFEEIGISCYHINESNYWVLIFVKQQL